MSFLPCLQIERRLLAWNMPAGVIVDNRRPFLRFRDKLRGELDAQVSNAKVDAGVLLRHRVLESCPTHELASASRVPT